MSREIHIQEDTQVDQQVESVKKLVSNFLGLLHQSIREQEQQQLLTQSMQRQISMGYPNKKNLSTILSTSEISSSRPTDSQPKSLQPSQDTQKVNQQDIQSSRLEERLVIAAFTGGVASDRSKEQESLLLEKKISCSSFQPQSQRQIISQEEGESSKFSGKATTLHSRFQPQEESELNSTRRIFNYQDLLGECQKALGVKHASLFDRMSSMVRDYRNYISILEDRNNQILIKSEKYKVRSDHLYLAIENIREAQKNLVTNYVSKRDALETIEATAKSKSDLCDRLTKDIQSMKSQNSYLKELIMLANKNYENLEVKLKEAQIRAKKAESVLKEKEMELLQGNGVMKDVLLKLGKQNAGSINPVQKKKQEKQQQKSHSPAGTNSKGEIMDVYRKMFIKTLKTAKK